jgi:hypothetical protein
MANEVAPSGTISGSGDNIDLSQVSNEDIDQLAAAIETFYKQDGNVKARLSQAWERTMRFIDGDQWLVWSGEGGTGGTWNRLTVSKENEYIPRPVTNIMFHCYETLKSYLTKTKPRSSVKPNTQRFEDKAAAKVADICLEANWERLKEQENYEYAASVLLAYGTVFKKDYWDTTAGSAIEVPSQNADVLGAQASLEGVMAGAQSQETIANETISLGDVATAVIEPYRIAVDLLATDLHTARWIMEYSIQSLEWVRDTYGKHAPGYTGLADTVKEESSLNGSMRRFYELKNSSGIRGDMLTRAAAGSDRGTATLNNCAVVKEYYERPSANYPRGRLVVVANGVTLYAGDSPCEGPESGDWHPYSDCRWELVPGRYWAKGPLDAICELQKRLNSIDATIILTRKTTAIPQKLLPKGSGVPQGQWTGRPGQVIESNWEAGKPEIIPATGVDPTVFTEREQVIEEMKLISGAMDILVGDRPPGVNAASALSLLYEVGTGKLFPMLDRWKRFVEASQKKQLRVIAKNYQEPRPEYIKLLKQKNKELSESMIDKFLGADLLDNCNVIVEAGSNVPKLEAMKQMRLQEAAQMGAIDMTQPENRAEYQRQMGIVGFDNDIGPDKKRAEWENDCLDNILLNPDKKPVTLVIDDHEVHLAVHERRMKEPSWMELDPQIQQAYQMHLQEHEQFMAMAQEQQMMQAAMTGQPPQGSGSALDPTKTKGHGKGAPNSVREAAAMADVPPGKEER